MSGREEVGACLRLLRLARQWGLRHAAAAARLPLSRLSEIERGKGAASHARIEGIVEVLGYPMLCFEIARLLVRSARWVGVPRQPQGTPGCDQLPLDILGQAVGGGSVGIFAMGAFGLAQMTPAEVGVCLQVLRRTRARTQRETAAAVGLSLSRWSEVERGQGSLPHEAFAALIGALGYPPAAFELVGMLVRMGQAAGTRGDGRRRMAGVRLPAAAGAAAAQASAGVAVGLLMVGGR